MAATVGENVATGMEAGVTEITWVEVDVAGTGNGVETHPEISMTRRIDVAANTRTGFARLMN